MKISRLSSSQCGKKPMRSLKDGDTKMETQKEGGRGRGERKMRKELHKESER